MTTPTPYRLLIEREGINHVKVLQSDGKGGYYIAWHLPLKGDDEPIVFKAFYSETQFVIINWNGWIRVFDAQEKTTLLDHALGGNVSARAVFSLDKTQIYIAFDDDDGTQLATLTLASMKLTLEELPLSYSGNLQIRGDGNLLFYRAEEEPTKAGRIWLHGYDVFNTVTKTTAYFELPFAPRSSFENKEPVISTTRNIGIMPYWGEIETSSDREGQQQFIYQILVFDLNTFTPIRTVAVRAFQISELECYESQCAEIAANLSSSDKNKEYDKAYAAFIENLNSIQLTDQDSAVWLCWRAGIVRKVQIDGLLYPLLVTASLQRAGQIISNNFSFFHSVLFEIKNDALILEEDGEYFRMPIPELHQAELEDRVSVPITITTLDEQLTITSTPADQKITTERDKITINVNSLSQPAGFLEALEQIKKLSENIANLGTGTTLAFLIKDKEGNEFHDKTFFAAAIQFTGAKELIHAIVENFIKYPKAHQLYLDSEKTAFCFAVYELAQASPDYLDTALRYLAAIDADHDVFNVENLIPLLANRYRGSKLDNSIQNQLKTLNDDWLEQFLYEE